MPLSMPNRSQIAVGVTVVIALAIVGGLVWAFGQQLARARQMRAEEVRLEKIVADTQAHHDELVARLEYVQSDEYVEQWARGETRMARPGETVVIVLADSDKEQAVGTQPAPISESEDLSFWAELWELILEPSGR